MTDILSLASFKKTKLFSIYIIISDLLNKFQPLLTKGLRTFVPLHFIDRTEHPNPSPRYSANHISFSRLAVNVVLKRVAARE